MQSDYDINLLFIHVHMSTFMLHV